MTLTFALLLPPLSSSLTVDFNKLKKNFNVCLFERQRQSMSGGKAKKGGDTESEAGPRLWAVSTESDAGLQPTSSEIVTWAEEGCLTDWATQVPLSLWILNFFLHLLTALQRKSLGGILHCFQPLGYSQCSNSLRWHAPDVLFRLQSQLGHLLGSWSFRHYLSICAYLLCVFCIYFAYLVEVLKLL